MSFKKYRNLLNRTLKEAQPQYYEFCKKKTLISQRRNGISSKKMLRKTAVQVPEIDGNGQRRKTKSAKRSAILLTTFSTKCASIEEIW